MAIGKVIKGDAPASETVVRDERAALPRPARAGVMNAEIFEARQSAQSIIEEAQRERERILAEAEVEREAVLAKAQDQGRKEGLAQSNEAILRAKMQAREIVAGAEREIVELALKIAQKIIGRDVERSPELVMDICANAIESVRSARSLVLRLHPDTAKFLRERKADLMQLIGRSVDLAIREDPEVDRVGCIIQTEFGTVEADLPTQLEMLQNVLLPATGRKEGPA